MDERAFAPRPENGKIPELSGDRALKPIDQQRARQKIRARRAALKALDRTRRAAEQSGVALSDWEGEFLGSVESRVEKYGRAFADPEKGAQGASLSRLQGVKLKEIAAKASGKEKRKSTFKPRKGFVRAKNGR